MRNTLARWCLYLLCLFLMIGALWLGMSLSLEIRPAKPVAQNEYEASFSTHEEPRSGEWPRVRREHLEKEPTCAVCGTKDDLNVHHVLSFETHPSLELDDANLITLCRHDHFVWGHLLEWKLSDPDVRAEVKRFRERVAKAKRNQ